MPAETYVRDGNVWREPSEIYIRDGGVWREASEVYVRNGGVWRQVYQASEPITSVTLTTPISDIEEINEFQTISNSYQIVPTITGGSGPFTYLWSQAGGSGLNNSSTTGSTLTLTYPSTSSPGDGATVSATETWRVTVTNANGSVASNNAVITVGLFGNHN